jgi:hypothetical protein
MNRGSKTPISLKFSLRLVVDDSNLPKNGRVDVNFRRL